MRKFILVFLVLSTLVFAERAGVVIQYSNSSFIMKCVEFQSGNSALDVLKSSGVQVVAKDYGSTLGAALCKIEDTGCGSDNCFCQSSYWGFYYVENGSWSYSPVGVSKYYARDGDVLGFRWGAYGEEPTLKSFSEMCNEKSGKAEIIAPDTTTVGRTVIVKMVSGNGNPLAYESIIVDSPKGRKELITNENGEATFNASEGGVYSYSSPKYSISLPRVTNVMKSSEVSLESPAQTPSEEKPASVGMAAAGVSPEILGAGVVLVLLLLYFIQKVI